MKINIEIPYDYLKDKLKDIDVVSLAKEVKARLHINFLHCEYQDIKVAIAFGTTNPIFEISHKPYRGLLVDITNKVIQEYIREVNDVN